MTTKNRKAIVQYWLWKHWMGTSLFLLMILFTSQASAEVKAIQAKPLEQKTAVKVAAAAPAKNAAKDEKKNDEKVVEKTVKGTVSYVRKDKMAIEYGASAEGGLEILLGISKDVKFKKAKSTADIAQGDVVAVKYLETYREPKTPGGEKWVFSMVVTEITLVNKAKPVAGAALEAKGKLLE